MKRFGKYLGLALAAASLATVVMAQPDEKDKRKDKEREVQQIIITNKGDKNKKEKMTIVIDGDNVTVNGKPVDEFKGDGVTVMKSRYGATSPMAMSFGNGQNLFTVTSDSNRAMLGVVTEKNEEGKGISITDVTDESGADKAGLKEDDIILKIDDKNIEDPDDLSEIIKKHKPGDKVSITYLRDNKEQKVTAELGKWKGGVISRTFSTSPDMNFNFDMPDLEGLAQMPRAFTMPRGSYRTPPLGNQYWFDNRPKLGISVQDTEDGKGVKVIEVDEEGNAGKAGIKEEDVITKINDTEVNSADQVAKIVRENKDKISLKFQLTRNGKAQTIEVKMPRKLKTADL